MTSFLQITLLSPLHTSGGAGRAGDVARDVVFDHLGLPYLPARRLKGLWRDAYRDLHDALSMANIAGWPQADELFGDMGAIKLQASPFRLSDAILQDAEALSPSLQWAQEQRIFSAHDVQEHFTALRSQTAIDRELGSAKENTLRRTRVLQTGLCFRAPISWRIPPNDAILSQLALAASALQNMGLMRTRGFGSVRCEFFIEGKNKTQESLQKKEPFSFSAPASPTQQTSSQPLAASIASPSTPAPTHILRYRLHLKAKALLPSLEGDANTTITQTSIIGRTLLGLFAWRYLERQPQNQPDASFWHLFQGATLFLPAYPESQDAVGHTKGQRLLPLPHSLRRLKSNKEQAIDLASLHPGSKPEEPVKRLRGYAYKKGTTFHAQDVKTSLSYHHFRAKDRRYGRAIESEEDANGGGLFVTEALESGQSYQAAILGSEADLLLIKGLWKDEEHCFVGRSRSAEYGGKAQLMWLDAAPVALDTLGSQESSWSEQTSSAPSTADPCSHFLVRCLSPLLTTNSFGHPTAAFPIEEFAERLDVTAAQIEIKRSWTRIEWLGGYWSHLRLPRPQWPAIAAGSVFEISLRGSVSAQHQQRLSDIERSGLGLKRNEGFGQIAIQPHTPTKNAPDEKAKNYRVQSIKKEKTQKPDFSKSPLPETLSAILSTYLQRYTSRHLQSKAMELATSSSLDLSRALIGRLSLLFRQNPLSNAFQQISEMKQAGDVLDKKQLDTGELHLTERSRMVNLKKFLAHLCQKASEQTKHWLSHALSHKGEAQGRSLKALIDNDEIQKQLLQQASDEAGEGLIKEFLLTWLSEMRKKGDVKK